MWGWGGGGCIRGLFSVIFSGGIFSLVWTQVGFTNFTYLSIQSYPVHTKTKKNLPDFALVLYNNLRISFPLHMTNNLFSCMFPCCVAYMTLTSRPPTFEPASQLHLRSHIDIVDECEKNYCESVTSLAMMYPTFITFANVASR